MTHSLVFTDLYLAARRNRLHVVRWVYAGWLVLVLLSLQFLGQGPLLALIRAFSTGNFTDTGFLGAQVLGGRFTAWFASQQSLFIYLLVPVFAAGAIPEEKRSGTLLLLLMSEVTPTILLVARILSRAAISLLVLLAAGPLFALMAGYAGVSPQSMGLVIAETLLVVFGLTSVCVTVGVFCATPRDAIVACYFLVVVGGLVVAAVGGPLRAFDPNWVSEPAWAVNAGQDLGPALDRLARSAVAWVGVSAVGLVAGSLSLAGVYRRELEGVKRSPRVARRAAEERDPVTANPVDWREQLVEGLAPNAFFRRIPTPVAVAAVALLSTVSSVAILVGSLADNVAPSEILAALLQLNPRRAALLMPAAPAWFLLQGILVMLLGSLLVGVRCAASVTQERERGTWEALLLTPVSAGAIVRGKLFGVMKATTWYLLAYAVPAVPLSAVAGPFALTYTLTWLAATVLAMYFIGAVGVWSSVRSKTSWRSLLATVAFGYLGGVAVYVICTPAVGIVALIFVLILTIIDIWLKMGLMPMVFGTFPAFMRTFSIASAVTLTAVCWFLAFQLMRMAQRHIADKERTRHWYDSPVRREPRRIRR